MLFNFVLRQHQGYSGRTNKDTDSCYSFWVGATLKLLGEFSYTDISSTMDFLLNSCQSNATGGFSKIPKSYPDILHSFYSLSWLSMTDCPNIKPIDPRFGICSEIASCY
jgi:geranylgeranyl transferase type-1 subunit beta